jgi:outer membrane protein TolC
MLVLALGLLAARLLLLPTLGTQDPSASATPGGRERSPEAVVKAAATAPDSGHEANDGDDFSVLPAPDAVNVSLEEAISLALEGNFSVATATDGVAAARLEESAVLSEFFPKVTPRFRRTTDDLTTGVDVSQAVPWAGGTLRADFTTRNPHDELATRSSDLRVLYVQPLLRGFGPNSSFNSLRNARRQRQGQERALELARQSLIVQVTQAFFQVVKQRKLLEVARQSERRSSSLRRASESRMKVGLVSKLDVFRAEIQASQARESAVAAETGLETAIESFRLLLGKSPREPIEPEDVHLDDDISLEVEPIEVLVERARAQRLDLRESRDRVDDARRLLALATQNLLPTLDLNLEFSQTGVGQTLGESLKPLDRRFTVTVSAGYAVERTADRARRAISRLGVRSMERSLEERELSVEAEVRSAFRQIERLKKSIELQRQGLDFAEQQQRLATLRYQRGLASNFDVVDAEGNLVSARTALVNLLTDLLVARVQLLRATGVLDLVAVEAIHSRKGIEP